MLNYNRRATTRATRLTYSLAHCDFPATGRHLLNDPQSSQVCDALLVPRHVRKEAMSWSQRSSGIYSLTREHREATGSRRSSGGSSPASNGVGPGSTTGQSTRDVWWTKWHWDRSRLSSGGSSPASNSVGPGSTTGQSTRNVWWTKWHWDRFFSDYFRFPLVSIIPPMFHEWLQIKYAYTIPGRDVATVHNTSDSDSFIKAQYELTMVNLLKR
jgi:hypothetical protein